MEFGTGDGLIGAEVTTDDVTDSTDGLGKGSMTEIVR